MRRVRHVVAGVLGGAVLAGCGGAPQASPPPSADPSESVSPSPAAPQAPANLDQRTEEGAIAAARYFLEALNAAGQTGSTDIMRSTYAPSCTRCEALADGIDKTYEGGGRIEGKGWVPTDFQFYGFKGEFALVDAAVDYAPQTWVRSAGADAQISEAKQGVLKVFQLAWRPGAGWTVAALDPVA